MQKNMSHKFVTNKKIKAVAIILISFSITFAFAYAYWQNIPRERTPTWTIYQDPVISGLHYNAKAANGTVVFTSSVSSTVIQDALTATTNGLVLLQTGNYSLTSTISMSNPFVTLEGKGNPILTVPSNFNYKIIDVSGDNDEVTGITINAQGQRSNANIAAIFLEPTASDCTIKDNYITGATTGIMACDNGSTISGNTVLNSIHDGITIEGGNFADYNGNLYGGDKISITNNLVNGTQIYNGISLVAATNSIVQRNIVISPESSGIALENLGVGECVNDLISGNSITNVVLYNGITIYVPYNNLPTANKCQFDNNEIVKSIIGLYVGSGTNLQFSNNQIYNVQNGICVASATASEINGIQFCGTTIKSVSHDGMQIEGGSNLRFENTKLSKIAWDGIYVVNASDATFNSYIINGTGGDGIWVDNPCTLLTFTQGTLDSCAGSYPIYVAGLGISNVDFEQTTVVNAAGSIEFNSGNGLSFIYGHIISPTAVAIRVAGATTNWIIDGNVISGAKATGIYVTTTGNDGSILNNTMISSGASHAIWLAGSGGNIVVEYNLIAYTEPGSIGIYNDDKSTTANSVMIVGNNLTHCLSSSTNKITDSNPNYTNIQNNAGYNPWGNIASPISGSGSYLVNDGSSSTWTSGTTYTNSESPKTIYISGGTVTAITVNGKTVATSTSSTTIKLTLNYRDTFSMTFSSAPTVTVDGK